MKKMKVKFLFRQVGRQVQRMRNIIAILALFVCTSICLGLPGQTIEIKGNINSGGADIAGNGNPSSHGKALTDDYDNAIWNNPKDNRLIIKPVAKVGNAYGAYMNAASIDGGDGISSGYYMNAASVDGGVGSMTSNEVIVEDVNFHDRNINRLIINPVAVVGNDYGAYMNAASVDFRKVRSMTSNSGGFDGVIYMNTARTSSGAHSSAAGVVDGISSGYYMNAASVNGGVGSMTSNEVIVEDVNFHDRNINRLIINPVAVVGNDYGAYMNAASVDGGVGVYGSMTNNEVIVESGNFHNRNIAGAFADSSINDDMNVSSNTVRITGGSNINDVYGGRAYKGIVSSNTVTISSSVTIGLDVLGGYIIQKGTATLNKVNLTSVTVKNRVFGAYIETDGYASSNTVTIISGTVGRSVFGGYINQKGTATGNTVTMTDVKVTSNVFGARIGDGYASSNTVKIISGTVGNNVFGAWIENGLASSNTVIIISGTVGRSVYGGHIDQKGTATENKVNLTDVKVTSNVCGAWIRNGYASSNTVIIISGTVGRNVFGGYIDQKGTATGNTVTITTGTTVTSFVNGGWVNNGDAIDNRVTLISGTVRQSIYGGYVDAKGNAMYNTVTINDSKIENNVYGGRTSSGTVYSNTVTITSGAVKNVFGGYIVKNGTAILNEVNLTSVTVKTDVYGARIENGLASSNTVIIISGTVGRNVYGGYIDQKGTATGNKVNLTDVKVTSDVYGAVIRDGYASSNTVTIISGTVQNVYGARIENGSGSGLASSNTVKIISGTVGNNVFGARIGIGDGLASSNTVIIISGTVGRSVYGGHIDQKGTATLNTVNLTDVKVTSSVCGAWIRDGYASSNTVTIISGTVGNNVYGARIENGSGSGLASSNTVKIISGTVGQSVFGGCVIEKGTATINTVHLTDVKVTNDVLGAWIGNGSASNNTVIINGGEIEGNVYGGFVNGNGNAINNTITITGKPKFSGRTILCGGVARIDAVTGNTLNIIETRGVEVNGISNFENYNFYLPEGIGSNEPILKATSGGCSWNANTREYTDDCPVDLENSKIWIYTNKELDIGNTRKLIYSLLGFKEKIREFSEFKPDVNEWVAYQWRLTVAFDDKVSYLKATLIDKKGGSVSKLVAGEYGALIGLVNQGTDFVVSRIEEAERLVGGREGEIEVFFGVGANKSEYNTGTEIEMVGTSMMGGIGIGVEVGGKELCSKEQSSKEQSSKDQSSPGQNSKELVTGVFVEHGNGNSEVICEKKSKGSNEYIGGGVLGKYNFYEDDKKGRKIYGEAVLRAGRVSNKFKGNGLKDARGKELEYEAGMMYGGCEVGGGYKHKVSEKIDVDWSLRYMFGRQNEKDVTMSDERIVKFESVLSNRIRLGVRGKYEGIEQIKPYVGIGYEHELSGKIKAVVPDGKDHVEIPASSFGGGTEIVELGVSGKVWKLDVDISGQGYVGKVRKGFGGLLKLKYAFGKDAHAKPQPKDK